MMNASIRQPSSIPLPQGISFAPLPNVSLEKLQANDSQEIAKVFEACRKQGFFLLDLQKALLGEDLMADADALMDLNEEIFGLSPEEKVKFALPKGGFSGYKAEGMLKIDAKGTPDRCEYFGVLKDELMGLSPLNQPDAIKNHRELYLSFTKNAHKVAEIILGSLNESLQLPPGTLGSLHRISAPSRNQARLIKYPPQPASDRRTSFVPHTDFGSVTILFSALAGLQILPDTTTNDWSSIPNPDESAWQFVRPRPNCAIINVGDAMAKFTNGLLHSGLHRVVPAPGGQGDEVRVSLGYFVRPEDGVLLKRLDFGSAVIPPLEKGVVEQDLTSAAWIDVKGSVRRMSSDGK